MSYCMLVLGALCLLSGHPRGVRCRSLKDAVLPVGGTLIRSQEKGNSTQLPPYQERKDGQQGKPRLATTVSKTTHHRDIHDAFTANKNECTNKIPRSSAFCKKNYDFGIEVHIIRKHRSAGYNVKVSRVYKNTIQHTDGHIPVRATLDIDFSVPTSPAILNKQLLSRHCPMLRANHTYTVFGYAKARDVESRKISLTLNLVLELPPDQSTRRKIHKRIKKLTSLTCDAAGSTLATATAAQPTEGDFDKNKSSNMQKKHN